MSKYKYTEDNPLKVFTAFSGYDSQCLALDRIGIPYELVGWSEIDDNAIRAHNALYPQYADRNYGDIQKIDWKQVPDFDLFTFSSPCTDWSAAGLQRGGAEGSGTRSSLLWECRKAILEKKPKYLLFENVKALVCKKFIPYFNKWLSELEGYGYTNYWKIMNAKDYGVPQNRERVFCVSVLGDHDIYHFPLPQELELRLKDILEPEVDDKYVLSDTAIEGFLKHNLNHLAKGTGFLFKPKEVDLPETEGGHQVANCLRARAALNATDNTIKERIRQYPTPCRQDREEEQRICTSKNGNGK